MSHAFGRGFLDTLTQHPPTGHQLRPPTGPYNPPVRRPVGPLWTAAGDWRNRLQEAGRDSEVEIKDDQGSQSRMILECRIFQNLPNSKTLRDYIVYMSISILRRIHCINPSPSEDLDGAAREYKKANDWLSLCRASRRDQRSCLLRRG